jgi:hypothetical protein
MTKKVIITKSKIDNLANSISTKSGVSTPMTLTQMKAAVDSIITGDGGVVREVWQDENGYVHLSNESATQITMEPLTIA